MRKHHLTLITCLLLSACATDDVNRKASTGTPAKKRAPDVGLTVSKPSKVRKVRPPAAVLITRAPIDSTVVEHRNRGKAALITAVNGALERDSVDQYVEQQVEELQRTLQSEIDQGEIRVEKRNGDSAIRVSMTPASGFDNLSSVVKPGFLASLSKLAPILNQYGKTMLSVIGYIEHVGPDADNLKLAERRAKSVTDYFINQNVDALRLQSYARNDPARSDNGPTDDQPMRRVELWIQPVVGQ